MQKAKPKKRSLKTPKRPFPLWKGPEKDGITQSMISKWLVCRERARLEWVEGWKAVDEFNHRIEYGNMWHECEEGFAKEGHTEKGIPYWRKRLDDYVVKLCEKYPTQKSQIEHWYRVCLCQFPIYVRWWSEHPDIKNRTPVWQEKTFRVPYKLPTGRIVTLRGKFDSVDIVQRTKRKREIWLQENKAKGDIDEQSVMEQLHFDLQSGMYLTALQILQESEEVLQSADLTGVRYNVVRRPLSGGKGSIVRHKATKTKPEETKDHYYDVRLKEIIEENCPHFFFRPHAEFSLNDLNKYQREFLNPILTVICDWWDWVGGDGIRKPFEHPSGLHFRSPYGAYNPLQNGRPTQLDYFLKTGNSTGLRKIDALFPEL